MADDRVGVVFGDDQDQADAHVEDAVHLGRSTEPRRCSQGKTGGTGHDPRRSRMAQPSGRMRGGLSIRPPPVMCAMPCTIRLTR